MALRDSWDCLYVWEGIAHDFYGLVIPSSTSPTWWGWISWGDLMSLDVLLREVHEEFERICSSKRKTRGVYGRGVHIIWVFLLCKWVKKHIKNTPGTVIWDDERDEYKREGELLQTNGKRNLIKSKWLIVCQISTH